MLEDRMQLADELGQLTPSGVQGPGRLAPFFVKRWQPEVSSDFSPSKKSLSVLRNMRISIAKPGAPISIL
jgi:hypothetical protein